MGSKRATDDDYVMQPMFTYLGNKRSLLPFIRQAVEQVLAETGRPLRSLDAFSGSTVVSRMLAGYCSHLYTNDLEPYAREAARCFLERPTEEQRARVLAHLAEMNAMTAFEPGVLANNYAPERSDDVQEGERCFFTRENAERADTWRAYVELRVAPDVRHWCIVPIMVQMSARANSYGHFKAFVKDRKNVGSFQTLGRRATAPMELSPPVFNPSSCAVECFQQDAVELVRNWAREPLDLIYLDPPYGASVEYAAFYFLHNVLLSNECPRNVNAVTGLPKERHKSAFNSRTAAAPAMAALLAACIAVARVTLLSYSDDHDTISKSQWRTILEPYDVQVLQQEYLRYGANRGAEPEGNRTTVKEQLFIIRAKQAAH